MTSEIQEEEKFSIKMSAVKKPKKSVGNFREELMNMDWKRYHAEYPWPSAQAEISTLGAYKTPRDKVACVYRCATTIMNLLSMASEGGVPAADDFVPVLVFVLIEANPPALLSTIQFVESFYSSRLGGEQQYWWIQFCSAIEFIKTMDYGV